MSASEGIREVTGEMIKLQKLLRQTSPSHNFTEGERKLFFESIERAEGALKRLAGEARAR